MPRFELLVNSFGGGQDGTAIFYRWLDDPDFRQEYSCNRFVMVMSSTGPDEEHKWTYEHVDYISGLCKENGIEFYFLTPELGYHSDKWPGLRAFYRRTNTVGSKAFPKTCTDNLKIQPIYRWLNRYVGVNYKIPRWQKQKSGITTFSRLYGNIGMILGIAANEASARIGDRSNEPNWMRLYIDKLYPLVEWGWDRARCQVEMLNSGRPVAWPSNCKICPFMGKVELLWLYRNDPDLYQEWVGIEANKIRTWEGRTENNLGVFGKKLLPEVLKEAIRDHGHMTDSQLNDYKFSHGHCVQSRY